MNGLLIYLCCVYNLSPDVRRRLGCDNGNEASKRGIRGIFIPLILTHFAVFNNHQTYPTYGQTWPRRPQSSNPTQWRTPTFAPGPALSPKSIPEQTKILGANTFSRLLDHAGLTGALKAQGPFTIFAPTDEAFEELIGKLKLSESNLIPEMTYCTYQHLGRRGAEYKNELLSDRRLLQNILLQHVAPGRLSTHDLTNGMRIKTLADNTLTILDTKDGKTIAGSLFVRSRMNQVAENGVVHFIESVIYPYVSDEEATTPRPKSVRYKDLSWRVNVKCHRHLSGSSAPNPMIPS